MGSGVKNAGKLFDFSTCEKIDTKANEEIQKQAFGVYTSGHAKKGVL